MVHWMCTTCGYYLQGAAPPDRCPSCQQVCAFNDVTCYRPECGGERNLDPLAVGAALRIIKGGPLPAAEPAVTLPSSKAISLVELLKGEQNLSFWPIPEVDILKGVSKEQRRELRNLGRIEHYEPNVIICTEGAKAEKFYLVEEGQVAVESRLAKDMRFPITIIYSGQAFGWSALVVPYLYTATVVALYKTRVIALEQEALLSMMRANPSFGLTIMENVASIVGSRLRALEMQLVGLGSRGLFPTS
jgi:CRP-like cAMP-binding protein/rubredoxin